MKNLGVRIICITAAVFCAIILIANYIDEQELKSSAATLGVPVEQLRAQQSAAHTRTTKTTEEKNRDSENITALIRQCKSYAKDDAEFPSSVIFEGMFGPDFPSSATSIVEFNGHRQVLVPISALNSFGNRVPSEEICIVENEKIVTHHHKKR